MKVQLLNFNLWWGPGSRVPGCWSPRSLGPSPTFTPCPKTTRSQSKLSLSYAIASISLIFSIGNKSKFSRNSTLVFESFIKLSMLVKSVSPAHSVIISQTKLILGLGALVKSIYGAISSRAEAKSVKITMVFYLSWLTSWIFSWIGYKRLQLATTLYKIFSIEV